ncbi:hypothetical protein [Psychrobacillus sp. OK032]|uniref:hypothetical protein n=1 Tax=Psychrobacillus sp. OK032 TaxID=1884358 RepID=UPI0008CC113D|nr:hypothetical protein [Psychrobacillus sp. OK032]SES38557.1 hypothetical protein SAMN05518872_109193 [Psychrobacillus sp. OK032]
MRITVGILSILFGTILTNITINSRSFIENIISHAYGVVFIILGAILLIHRKNKKGKVYARPMGIAIAMSIYGIVMILKPVLTSSAGLVGLGVFFLIVGLILALVDYLEE